MKLSLKIVFIMSILSSISYARSGDTVKPYEILQQEEQLENKERNPSSSTKVDHSHSKEEKPHEFNKSNIGPSIDR